MRLSKAESLRNGVMLQVSVPTAVNAGDSVALQIRLTNTGKETAYFGEINDFAEYDIDIHDPSGSRPLLTTDGKYRLGGDGTGDSLRRLGGMNIIPILPGNFKEWKIDLAQSYIFKPGKYSLSVSLNINPQFLDFPITSKPITFSVK